MQNTDSVTLETTETPREELSEEKPTTQSSPDVSQEWAPVFESILFAAERPISVDRLLEVISMGAEAIPITREQAEGVVETLKTKYSGPDFGFELREAHGGVHLVSKMAFAPYVQRFQMSKPFRLGRSAMETLSIIAYRQPITRAEIDQVRGIDSSHLLRTLVDRGMVRMAGKADVPGRPVQYGTTERFLEVVGLKNLADLPPLSELQQLQGDAEDPQAKLERGLDRFLKPDPADAIEQTEDDAEGLDFGLSEIDMLIQQAGKPAAEVFKSELHSEVAKENQLASEAPAPSRKRKQQPKSLSYNEVVSS